MASGHQRSGDLQGAALDAAAVELRQHLHDGQAFGHRWIR
jgi:hypothetical protein